MAEGCDGRIGKREEVSHEHVPLTLYFFFGGLKGREV